MKPIYKKNNKLKGCYGQTTTEKGKRPIIEINKKAHKSVKKDKSIPKRSRTLIDTIVHETMHARHPKMHEKTVRKNTPNTVARMSKKSKSRLYSTLGQY